MLDVQTLFEDVRDAVEDIESGCHVLSAAHMYAYGRRSFEGALGAIETALAVATQRADAAEAESAAEVGWLREMLADYHKLAYDDHTHGRHFALNSFIHEMRAERDALRAQLAALQEEG